MAALLRAAASRFRPFCAASVGAVLGVVATAASVAADDAKPANAQAAAGAAAVDGEGEFGVYLDSLTQRKIRSAFPPKYPVLRAHKVLVNAVTAAKLRRFAGCGVKLGIEIYVDDGQRQVLQLRVKEPEPFGKDADLAQDKLYVVLSSRAKEEDDEEPGSGGASARQAVTHAVSHLGHMMDSTTKWVRAHKFSPSCASPPWSERDECSRVLCGGCPHSLVHRGFVLSLLWSSASLSDVSLARLQSGTAKNDLGGAVNYTVEKVDSLELLGVLCSDKTWDAQKEHCDCECSGYVACACNIRTHERARMRVQVDSLPSRQCLFPPSGRFLLLVIVRSARHASRRCARAPDGSSR